MRDRPLEIPEHSGEVLLVPGRVDLVAVARRNRDRLSGERTPIAGVPLSDLRVRARDEILTLARAYTAALELGPVAAGDLLLSTGHQPVFPHPGIWVKDLLLDRLAARGHTGLHVIVDSDAMEETGVDLPSHPAAFLERRREVLRAAGAEEAYEGQPAPTGAEWADFIRRVDGHVQTVREEAVRRPWDAFRALGRPAAADYAAFLTALRRRYEGPRHLLDVPVSMIAETPSFRAFFLHIAADATRFLDIHNTHLEAYREQQRIRTEAQPFPNLTAEGNRIELPFWTVAGGRRRRLLLDAHRRVLIVQGDARATEVSLPGDVTAPVFARLQLRPRALILTAFLRLLVVDLFIHGVSGGRYDRVTDAVIAEFFGVPPPIYAVASATLYLPFAESADPEAARQSLQRMIQEARHNPERVLTEPTPEQRTLIEEKWQWIRRLEAPDLTRPERRAATQAIRALNERLSAALAERVAALEAALAALDQHRGPTDAAVYRGYPYFLHRLNAVEDLVTRMLEAGT